METKQFYLKNFNLASNFSEAQMTDLCAITYQKESRKGQVVYAKGGEKKIFILISGKIKLAEISERGDEMIKELIHPGDLFGDITPVEQLNYEFAEVISERASFLSIGYDQFQRLMKANPSLAVNYLNMLSEKFKRLENRYVNMVTKDVKNRLLYYFTEWAKTEGKRLGDKIIIRNHLTHSDIANLISTSRQTVTVILNELKEAGQIKYNRKEIEFYNLQGA
ncbi:MAG TPA: Crp/Fnr family transcriptional regulator [Cyclobacteriaceae bacterium]|nr:Crp/Fnr family transcriptional regulator [Cyclobacteriaceae bacterium]